MSGKEKEYNGGGGGVPGAGGGHSGANGDDVGADKGAADSAAAAAGRLRLLSHVAHVVLREALHGDRHHPRQDFLEKAGEKVQLGTHARRFGNRQCRFPHGPYPDPYVQRKRGSFPSRFMNFLLPFHKKPRMLLLMFFNLERSAFSSAGV